MPEGDTLEFVARRLSPLVGVPVSVEAPHPRHARDRIPERLAGRLIETVEARGKHLLIRFGMPAGPAGTETADSAGAVAAAAPLYLHSHLRMSGRWSVRAAGAPWPRPAFRAWLVMRGAGLEAVLFDGPVLELLTAPELSLHPVLSRLGRDVLDGPADDPETVARAVRRLRHGERGREIGEALLDQRALAGIGNVWKSEVLFACRVDPFQPVHALGDDALAGLVTTAAARMQAHVASGDSARPVAVYGRRGRPCPRCGTRIRSRLQGDDGRVTYWCPTCQAPPVSPTTTEPERD